VKTAVAAGQVVKTARFSAMTITDSPVSAQEKQAKSILFYHFSQKLKKFWEQHYPANEWYGYANTLPAPETRLTKWGAPFDRQNFIHALM
jgi:hypothetical protein